MNEMFSWQFLEILKIVVLQNTYGRLFKHVYTGLISTQVFRSNIYIVIL